MTPYPGGPPLPRREQWQTGGPPLPRREQWLAGRRNTAHREPEGRRNTAHRATRETELINDYFRQAIIDLSASTAAFITGSTDTSITLTLHDRNNSALEPFIQKSCDTYCTSYALHAWFNITAPRLANKYADDCNRQMAAINRLLHEKSAPTAATSSPTDVETTIVTT